MHRTAILICVALTAPLATAAPEAEPGEDAHDMPAEIVEAVRSAEVPAITAGTPDLDRRAEHKRATDGRNRRYAQLRERFAKVEPRWKELEARKQVVDKAVVEAEALVKDGKLDDARKALEAVITPVARDDRGKVVEDKGRGFVEARDAEVPAIVALARIARDQHDWNAMFTAKATLATRHRIEGDQAVVRLLSLAWEDQSAFIGYNQSNPSAWANREVKAANDAAGAGRTLAATFDSGLGLAMIGSANGKLAKGDWVVMPHLLKLKVAGQQLSYSDTLRWRTPKACHPSSRILYVDDHGGVHFDEDCTYTEHSEKVSLEVTLREPVPAWAERDITLVGKVVAVGPHWKLTDAVVADTRFDE